MDTTPGDAARVLVVDDESLIAKSLARQLDQLGFATEYVCSGAAAVQRMGASRFDAVVLDLHMPEMDGIAVLGAIAGAPTAPVVVVVTGDISARAAIDAVRAGADDVLAKPTPATELHTRIDGLLRQRRA